MESTPHLDQQEAVQDPATRENTTTTSVASRSTTSEAVTLPKRRSSRHVSPPPPIQPPPTLGIPLTEAISTTGLEQQEHDEQQPSAARQQHHQHHYVPSTRAATHRRRRAHTDRVNTITDTPLGIALFAAWLLTLLAGFSFDAVLDVFQCELTLQDPSVVPWPLLTSSSVGFHVALVCIVVLLGRLTKRRFHFFQPFVGGDAFVVLQIVGYGAVSVSATVRALLLSQRQERYGAYTVLGIFALVGHSLLLWSLSFFQSPPSTSALSDSTHAATAQMQWQQPKKALESAKAAAGTTTTTSPGWRDRLARSPQQENCWIFLCGVIAVLSSSVAEYHPAYRILNVGVVLCFVIVSLLTIQYALVPHWLAGHFYHVLLPVLMQSPTLYVLQIFGNGLLGVTVYAEFVLLQAQQDAPPSLHLGCGLMAVMAIAAHLLVVHQLHAWAAAKDAALHLQASTVHLEDEVKQDADAQREEIPSQAGAPPQKSPSETTASAATHSPSHGLSNAETHKRDLGSVGPVLPSLFSVMLCVILLVVLYVSLAHQSRVGVSVKQGLAHLETLLVILLFLQPLVTHPMGVFLYGKAYRIWQPFEGNRDFILLQGVGWFCYGLAIFFATLQLNEHGHINFLLLLMAFLVLSQFFIHMSVVRFGRNGVKSDFAGPLSGAGTAEGADMKPTTTKAASAASPLCADVEDDGRAEEGSRRGVSESIARSDSASERGSSTQPMPYPRDEDESPCNCESSDRSPALRLADDVTASTDMSNNTSTMLPGASTPSPACGCEENVSNRTGADSFGTSLDNTSTSLFVSTSFDAKGRADAAPSLLSTVMNGELLLSIVLIGLSVVLRAVVVAAACVRHLGVPAMVSSNSGVSSATASRFAKVQIPATALIDAASLFSVAATPLVQWSMRHRLDLFHPCSHIYVALAALSWGTYLLLLSRFLVLWGLFGLEKLSLISPITRVGLSCFLPSAEFSTGGEGQSLPFTATAANTVAHTVLNSSDAALTLTFAFECAVEGFIWCFPFLCLLAGNLFQSHAYLREQNNMKRVRRAMKAVMELFQRNGSSNSFASGLFEATVSGTVPGTAATLIGSPRGTSEARLEHLLQTIAGSHVIALLAESAAPRSSTATGPTSSSSATETAAVAATAAAASKPSRLSRLRPENGSFADPADLKAVHDAARYMTTTLCAATSAAFLSAASLAKAQPVMTLGFGAVGTVALGLSCFSLHYIYGTRVHSGTRPLDDAEDAPRVPVYTLFMPFVGGGKFVFLQAVGWVCLTCVASLMGACAVEGQGTAVLFLLMAVLSIVAQTSLLQSVSVFDESQVRSRGFVQRNAEGCLAAISVAATVSACRVYDMAKQGRATAHLVSSLVPIAICSIAVCLAIPLGLVSLQRQAELYGLGSFTAWFADDEDGDIANDEGEDQEWDNLEGSFDDVTTVDTHGTGGAESSRSRLPKPRQHSRAASSAGWSGSAAESAQSSPLGTNVSSPSMSRSIYSRSNTENLSSALLGTPGVVRRPVWASASRRSSSRARSYAAVVCYVLATVLAVLVVTVLPFALMFLGYAYYTQRTTRTYDLAVHAVEALLCCFTALVLLPMLVVPVLGRSSTLRNVHSAFCCYALYNIPTYTVVGGVTAPFIYNCRGSYLFAINMCSMSLLSTLPYMPIAMLVFSMSSFAYFVWYHFYDGVYQHQHAFQPVQCVVDLVIAVFWLWYQRRYHGRPEVTGRLQSNRATRFFQRYFFRGFVYYFSMRVLVGEGYVLPQEEPFVADRKQLPRVNLSNPENQYLFSFHPHGVFPGTSIVAPKTEIWEKAVGTCKEHFVSTHCADVVFSVPLMREFPLCLGAMSVGRRGIESSLKRGNSPLIITGGQSEMLLTKMSDDEMHVVCHHVGFVRMALKNRVPLVPVISFSESNIMDNVHCVPIQRWFLNRIGFPFPVLPLGRWNLPLPTTKPVTIVVGQPILPLPGRDNCDDPAHVDELRLRYFEHLEVLFYKYRAEVGYPTMELYLHNGIYNAGVRGIASVPTQLRKGGVKRGDMADLSIEVFDSAVRRAFAMAPSKSSHGKSAASPATPASPSATSQRPKAPDGADASQDKKRE